LLVLLIAATGFYILDSLHNPGKSVLSASQKNKILVGILGRSPHLTETQTPTTWNVHTSRYISFSYPSWAKVYTADNAKAIKNGDSLDVLAFALLDERVTGVVNVVSFAGSLSEYPGVSLRLQQKDIYIPIATLSGLDTIGFSKQDDKSEKTLFIVKNGKIISVAVTGYSQDSVDKLFTPLVASLKVF